MIVVLDAGIIASGPVHATDFDSTTGGLIRALVAGRFVHATSAYILDEAERPLANKRYFRLRFGDERRVAAMASVRDLSVVVPLPSEIPIVAPHRHDDPVLTTVAASGADRFVTGDAALLGMGSFAGVPFADPAAFLAELDGDASPVGR